MGNELWNILQNFSHGWRKPPTTQYVHISCGQGTRVGRLFCSQMRDVWTFFVVRWQTCEHFVWSDNMWAFCVVRWQTCEHSVWSNDRHEHFVWSDDRHVNILCGQITDVSILCGQMTDMWAFYVVRWQICEHSVWSDDKHVSILCGHMTDMWAFCVVR